MGGGGGSEVTIGYRYFMSVHMGLSRGPIDELKEIRVGDQKAWPLDAQPTQTDDNYTPGFQINAPELFGGDKKEGGIKGTAALMMGKPTQDPPSWIRTLMGGRVPGFRGVATLFYDGLICSLNPYPKAWKMRMSRVTKGWDGAVWQPGLAAIPMAAGAINAMNPAHILYECATNRQWGRGLPRAMLDEAEWAKSAQTLFDEGFGMCLTWKRQDSLQAFAQSVVDHIGAALFIDRRTGLLKLSLIRGDYDVETIPFFDYRNGLLEISDADTATRDNAVNEVIVNWHDPIENKDRQVRVHNLASIQSLGAINSQTTDYAGIPTLDLATRVAQRDLKVVASALKRFKLKLDRRAWYLSPGMVIRVNAPDRAVNNLILRIGKFTENSITDGALEVEAVIDVFGLPLTTFVSEEEPQWTPPDTSAQIVSDRLVRESTYRDFVQRLDAPNLDLLTDTQSAITTVASKPSSLSLSYTPSTKTGSEPYVDRGAATFCPMVILSANAGMYDTTLFFSGGTDLGLIEVGGAIQVGSEILRLDDIEVDGSGIAGTLTVGRGSADTLPTAHLSGAKAYFTDEGTGSDFREYASGETVSVKLRTNTSSAILATDLAPIDTVALVARQAKPYAPADLKVNAAPYGTVSSASGAADVVLTWAHRDRLSQLDQLIAHTEASVGPEVGVTYEIKVFNSNVATSPVRTVSGVTGTSWTYTVAMQTADGLSGNFTFELDAARSGIRSFQKYRFSINRT